MHSRQTSWSAAQGFCLIPRRDWKAEDISIRLDDTQTRAGLDIARKAGIEAGRDRLGEMVTSNHCLGGDCCTRAKHIRRSYCVFNI